ncbi:MAG: hypothetical protein EBT08_12580, partial [Betaproteobacteria bacterium]|nr:hypothetical protein [Betaproteobacteria bacterium]
MTEARAAALAAWQCPDPPQKACAARRLASDWAEGRLSLHALGSVPGSDGPSDRDAAMDVDPGKLGEPGPSP